MKKNIKTYPLKQLLKELKEECGQSEITTMRHLAECKSKGLLDFDHELIYISHVDISE